ncbi:hypothetical protein [Bacillus testis]|uniref:hypothetical protein n=1 Tax=Bacillus testis TaxID=1622072 RepID=UPI00067F5019|nr:hypothetical protein [Bacillus testis]
MRKGLKKGITGGILFVLFLCIVFSYGMTNDRKQTAVASTSSVPKKAYELSHNFINNALQVKNPNGKKTSYPLNQYSDFPSYDYSPSGEKVVFTQYEWEEDGAVRIFSPAKGVETIVDSKKSKSSVTPRGAVWLDDRYILLVQGSKYGTVISGKLYVYDTKLKSTKPLPLFKGDAITNITTSKTGDTPIIALIGISFTDDNFNRNKPHVEYYPVAELLKKAKAL